MENQPIINGLFFGLIAGLLVGLVPLIIGTRKKQVGLGIGGFFASTISGAVLGLILAVPIAGVFTWLAIRNSDSSTGT